LIRDDIVTSARLQFLTRSDWIGDNVLISPYSPVSCDEDNYYYKDYKQNSCIRIINIINLHF